ncbi:MAG: two-component system, cell cycle sensor histidine kinase and response regulator CckA, partial [Chthoniobacter sp.]|nr:two-component system, cell cycle sensor histidine kinase and response regulator CckA [Chthoniobacter sp.]
MLLHWLSSNLDYLLFAGAWIVVLYAKDTWLRARGLAVQRLNWFIAAGILAGGWFFVSEAAPVVFEPETALSVRIEHTRQAQVHGKPASELRAEAYSQSAARSRRNVMIYISVLQIVVAIFGSLLAEMRRQLAERQRAEEARGEADRKLSLHVQQTPLGIIECDREGNITEWNAAAEKMFGWKKEEAISKNAIELLVPEAGRPEALEAREQLLRGTGGTRCTHENVTKNGDVIMCDWFNTSIPGSQGEVVSTSSLCEDITERQRAAAEIENLAAFPRLNPDPVLQFSAAGELVYFNEAAQQMAKSLGKEMVSDMLPEDSVAIIRECIATGNDKLKRETKIGARTILWSFFPIAAIRSVHCYATDCTERLNLEQQLRQSQKMQSVGQLAAGVAHDFNNILTIIQGHSELMNGTEKLTPPGVESLDQIRMAAERAAKLTHQLLTFGRKQFMQVELVDVNEVINRVTQMLRRVLGENVSLRCNLAGRLPSIEADVTMMEQIIMNLSVNARDAMPGGGSLIIGTVPVSVSRAYISQNPEAREGSFVCLSVSDNGTGIDTDKLGQLFEPFFTTKEVGKGTGLGLATVYGIVKQHQGWIEVESEVGKGTMFKVYLPSTTRGAASKAGKVVPQKVRGGRETILLVEDELGVLSLARGVLKSYGYDVLEARTGVEALRVWAQHDTRIDLLLTDIVM